MEKYFELHYKLDMIGLILLVVFVAVGIVYFLVSCAINSYRSKSKKWQYDYVYKGWERVKDEKRKIV